MVLEGTLVILGWTEANWDEREGESNLSRADVRNGYSGSIEGESSLQFLMCYAAGGAVPFVGMERVRGRIGEWEGSFVLQHTGAYTDGVSRADVAIVPGSGAGALPGITGSGEVIWDGAQGEPGRYRLEVEFIG